MLLSLDDGFINCKRRQNLNIIDCKFYELEKLRSTLTGVIIDAELKPLEDKMNVLKDMSREELLEVIRIKDILIKELRTELEAYEELARSLQDKIVSLGGAPKGE